MVEKMVKGIVVNEMNYNKRKERRVGVARALSGVMQAYAGNK